MLFRSTVTGTTHTMTASDLDLTRLTNAGAITLTLPETATEAVATGVTRFYELAGDGAVTVAAEAGATIQSENSYVNINTKYRTISVMVVAAQTFKVIGAEVAP